MVIISTEDKEKMLQKLKGPYRNSEARKRAEQQEEPECYKTPKAKHEDA